MTSTCTYFPLECTVSVWQMALIDTRFRRMYFHSQKKWKERERTAGERSVDNKESNNSRYVVTLSTAIHMYSLRLYYTPHYAIVHCWKVIVISSLRARYQASGALQMTSAHFWVVTQLSVVVTDVSGQPIGSILKGKLGCPETLVRNYYSG